MKRLLGFLLISICHWAIAQTRVIAVTGGPAVGSQDAGSVLLVDPSDGSMTLLGTPIMGEGLTGVAADSQGRFFACTAGFTAPPQLLEIDPVSGTLVQSIGDLLFGQVAIQLHDLAMQPGTDILYGAVASFSDDGPDQGGLAQNTLVIVDTATGALTPVGDPSFPNPGFAAIAFTSDGSLWALQFTHNELVQLDPTHANILSSTTTSIGAIGLGSLPGDQLLVSECCSMAIGNDIYELNPVTATAAFLGSAGADRRVHDFASFVQRPTVPTMGFFSMLILGIAIAIGAMGVARYRA